MRTVVAWRQTETDPVHAMLCREDGELGQCTTLSPDRDAEFVKPAAILSFQAPVA